MKSKILGLLITVGLFFSGCSDQSSISGPSFQAPQSSATLVDLNTNILSLQKEVPLYIEKTINGDVGGQIDIKGEFDEGKIQVNGTLTIPVGAYKGNQTITIFMKGKKAALDFGPSPFTFDIPLEFSMEITGVKIKDKDEEKIHFVYLDTKGKVSAVVMQGTTVVNKEKKTLSVYGAQLTHFSRYGWAK